MTDEHMLLYHIPKSQRFPLHADVDPIQDRTGHPAKISSHFIGRTAEGLCALAVSGGRDGQQGLPEGAGAVRDSADHI